MSPSDLSDSLLQQLCSAAKILQQGGVVAFPTESSYGIAANIHDDNALRKIYQLKGREESKALIVLVNSREQLNTLAAQIPYPYEALMAKFWPGALTLIFPCHKELNPVLTGGGETIAVRYSSHPVARRLVTAFCGPITATSANRAGELPCTTAEEIKKTFGNEIDMIIDGGKADAAPSTIITFRQEKIEVLREGQLPAALFSD